MRAHTQIQVPVPLMHQRGRPTSIVPSSSKIPTSDFGLNPTRKSTSTLAPTEIKVEESPKQIFPSKSQPATTMSTLKKADSNEKLSDRSVQSSIDAGKYTPTRPSSAASVRPEAPVQHGSLTNSSTKSPKPWNASHDSETKNSPVCSYNLDKYFPHHHTTNADPAALERSASFRSSASENLHATGESLKTFSKTDSVRSEKEKEGYGLHDRMSHLTTKYLECATRPAPHKEQTGIKSPSPPTNGKKSTEESISNASVTTTRAMSREIDSSNKIQTHSNTETPARTINQASSTGDVMNKKAAIGKDVSNQVDTKQTKHSHARVNSTILSGSPKIIKSVVGDNHIPHQPFKANECDASPTSVVKPSGVSSNDSGWSPNAAQKSFAVQSAENSSTKNGEAHQNMGQDNETGLNGVERFTEHKKEKEPEVELVEMYIHFLTRHDAKGIDFLAKPDTHVAFKETSMLLGEYLDEMDRLFQSFPDTTFEYSDIKRIAAGQVEVGYFRTSGTHTGKPYGFGPYPEVPTSNIKFKNDPSKLLFEIENGKFTKMTVIPSGEYCGPQGAYRQIGGFPL